MNWRKFLHMELLMLNQTAGFHWASTPPNSSSWRTSSQVMNHVRPLIGWPSSASIWGDERRESRAAETEEVLNIMSPKPIIIQNLSSPSSSSSSSSSWLCSSLHVSSFNFHSFINKIKISHHDFRFTCKKNSQIQTAKTWQKFRWILTKTGEEKWKSVLIQRWINRCCKRQDIRSITREDLFQPVHLVHMWLAAALQGFKVMMTINELSSETFISGWFDIKRFWNEKLCCFWWDVRIWCCNE